ncbi:Imm1 family immunity protein [Saccharopolyspora pogona]|uniref:Imm1 family immunity protein n=1 Tax=Saccharopolyspora pogona TaxID=333966 RepID=UPI00295AD3F3|nr:Imm1 family immunity protein [Saccharopolyspora pogona]
MGTRRTETDRIRGRSVDMATETRTVVTALFGRERRFAFDTIGVRELIRECLGEERARGVCFYVRDRPHDRSTDDRPGHQLRVNVDESTAWGAINFVREGEGGGAWDTHNPEPPADVPTVWFDATTPTPTPFERSAVLPIDAIDKAVAEFCRTGRRPICVQWQQGRWF